MEKEDYLPLFFYANDPLGVFIVDNEIIHFDQIGDLRHSGQYAFYLLSKLSSNDLLSKQLPEKLVLKQNDYFPGIKVPWPCLTGILFEHSRCRCLSAKMTIRAVNNQPMVCFSDFALMNGYEPKIMVDEIAGEIYFSPLEAYILLANQVATSYSDMLFQTYDKKHKNLYREYLRENIANHFHGKPAPDFGIFRYNPYYVAFCLDYFEYLEEQLLSSRITPYKILQLNGPVVINRLSVFMLENQIVNDFIEHTAKELVANYNLLSPKDRIMFYTLHASTYDFIHTPKSPTFQEKKKAITTKIFIEFCKPFPQQPQGDEDNIHRVWKRYDLPEPKYP